VVLHNAQGQFVAAQCKWHESIPDALPAEAYACRDAALLIRNLELTKVIVETDRQELVSLWNSRANNRRVILPVLNQIQELCRSCTHFDFVYVRREAKMAAHYTTKFALVSDSECRWTHHIPMFLLQCIQHDSHAKNWSDLKPCFTQKKNTSIRYLNISMHWKSGFQCISIKDGSTV
jgi:hypothetical protein